MRHYYLIVDTETTKKQTVADFGAVVMTKQGRNRRTIWRNGSRTFWHFAAVL